MPPPASATGHSGDEVPVVLVSSLPFSASTLLGLMLGSHPDVAFLGETDLLMRQNPDGSWRHRKFCSLCRDLDGTHCPVWSGELVDDLRRHRESFHPRLARRLGARILVDSSKDEPWWVSRLTAAGTHPVVLHVTKAPEAYVASLLTRHPLRRPIEFVAVDWAQGNLRIRDTALSHGAEYHHLPYAELAGNPEQVLARLGTALGFEPVEGQQRFWEHEHHNLRGNPGTASHFDLERAVVEPGLNRDLYQENHRRIFLDEKWRRVLSRAQVDRIHALPLVRRAGTIFGYQHPSRPTGSPSYRHWAARVVEPVVVSVRRARESLR